MLSTAKTSYGARWTKQTRRWTQTWGWNQDGESVSEMRRMNEGSYRGLESRGPTPAVDSLHLLTDR